MVDEIRISNLTKRFYSPDSVVLAIEDVSLSIKQNELVTVVGASGCGKSTLLRAIAGLDVEYEGVITVGGARVEGPGPDRSVVFQNYSIYPWLNVYQNIWFSRNLKANVKDLMGQERDAERKRAEALLELMGLNAWRDAYPGELSGGMRQRVAIARALMSKPRILLMDEPFGALDTQTKEIMQEILLHVFKVERPTIFFITHDVEEAIYLGQRVVVMAPKPGRIDSIFETNKSEGHGPAIKSSPDFIEMRETIKERIRASSGMTMDTEILNKITME